MPKYEKDQVLRGDLLEIADPKAGYYSHHSAAARKALRALDLLGDLRADRDRLASLVEKLRPWIRHDAQGCIPDPCSCGLADLLTEMENQ